MTPSTLSTLGVAAITVLGVSLVARAHGVASKVLVVTALVNTSLLALYTGQFSSALSWLGFWQAAPLVLMAALAEWSMRRRPPRVASHSVRLATAVLIVAALGQSISTFWLRQFAPQLGEPNVTWLLSPFRVVFIAATCTVVVASLWATVVVLSRSSKPAA